MKTGWIEVDVTTDGITSTTKSFDIKQVRLSNMMAKDLWERVGGREAQAREHSLAIRQHVLPAYVNEAYLTFQSYEEDLGGYVNKSLDQINWFTRLLIRLHLIWHPQVWVSSLVVISKTTGYFINPAMDVWFQVSLANGKVIDEEGLTEWARGQ